MSSCGRSLEDGNYCGKTYIKCKECQDKEKLQYIQNLTIKKLELEIKKLELEIEIKWK